jgi:mitofusin
MDNTLKVLITGDLNSGKSTLINAIFHHNILPTDQQPCTQSFCEVIPSDELFNVPKIKAYKLVSFNSNDEGDYMSHEKMKEELQNEESYYKWFKILVSIPAYVNNNSNQMCVSFIDSPGLNTDLFKTTSLFNQQQDIDVVVFVVNASFHLTLSGKEFLEQAAKEKEKIFFVVNKFDEIAGVIHSDIKSEQQDKTFLGTMARMD